MTLRKKTLLIIGATLAVLIVILLAASRAVLLNNYTRLEEREARRDVERAMNALTDDIAALKVTADSYAADDEIYTFMQTGAGLIAQRLFVNQAFVSGQFDLVVLVNPSGRVMFSKAVDLGTKQETGVMTLTLALLSTNSALLRLPNLDSSVAGLLITPDGALMVASRPILTARYTGPPRGTLIMARELNQIAIKRLTELTRLNLNLQRIDNPQVPAELRTTGGDAPRAPPVVIQPVSNERMVGYAPLKDLNGQPVLALQVNLPRELFRQGQADVLYFVVVLAVAGLVLSAVVMLILERLVLAPVSRLSADVTVIGTNGNFAGRVRERGKDELGKLARTINVMLDSLARLKQQVDIEHERAERLLINILPRPIAERLKHDSRTIADSFAEATVLFADIVGFTTLSAGKPPEEMVALLNEVFSAFDRLAEKHHLEKIKTIGDAYMAVGGLPEESSDHAEAVAEMALDMQAELERINREKGQSLKIRTGINTGPVVAGVIGTKKFIYDLWGDTVNTASRMESHGAADSIQVTEAVYEKLKHKYRFAERGVIEVKGKGSMRTYWLQGR